MVKDQRINVLVNGEQKTRWDQYVSDSPEVGSLAQLVRQSVELHIETNGGKESLGPKSGDVGALETDVKGIKNKLSSLEGSVNAVRQEEKADETNPSLQKAVYQHLPTRKEVLSGSDSGVVKPGVTAEELAEPMRAAVEEVEKTLQDLDDISPEVSSLHGGDAEEGMITVYHRKR